MSRLEESGLYEIDSLSQTCDDLTSTISVIAVLDRLGHIVTFSFRLEAAKAGMHADHKNSKWFMSSNLIPGHLILEMYDFTLYTRNEFEELLPGARNCNEAVCHFLCNFKPYLELEGAEMKHMPGSADFLVPVPPVGSTSIDLVVSIPKQSFQFTPCHDELVSLVTALNLTTLNVRGDDLLLVLLCLFGDINGFKESDWLSTLDSEAHLWYFNRSRLNWPNLKES